MCIYSVIYSKCLIHFCAVVEEKCESVACDLHIYKCFICFCDGCTLCKPLKTARIVNVFYLCYKYGLCINAPLYCESLYVETT